MTCHRFPRVLSVLALAGLLAACSLKEVGQVFYNGAKTSCEMRNAYNCDTQTNGLPN